MALTFRNVEKRIHDTLIFPSFNLTIGEGEIVAIHCSVNVRTQIVGLLMGKTHLSNGEIHIEENSQSQHSNIGFFLLDAGLYERLTVEENLLLTKKLYFSKEPLNEIIKSVQLENKRKTRVMKLSLSEKRRVHFANLLIQNPNIYILEEPEQNLDIESKQIFHSILQQLRRKQKCIFILTGNMENAVTAADYVYQLDGNGLHSIQIGTENTSEPTPTIHIEDDDKIVQPVRFEKIPTKVNEKIVLFDPPEIDYIESHDGQTFLQIEGEAFVTMFTLAELEERLLPFGFFRCHRSYIVNLQKVREIITWTRNSYSLVLNDTAKSTIPLSKNKMTELKAMLSLS